METDHEGFLIGALLKIPFEVLTRKMQAKFAEAGFSDIRPSHLPVFQILPPEGCRVSELAERAWMTKQSMGYLVDSLEERGYVERSPDPEDGRAEIIRRTARGWDFNRTARRLVQGIQDEWAEQLGRGRMEELIKLLTDLANVIGVPYNGSISETSVQSEHKDIS